MSGATLSRRPAGTADPRCGGGSAGAGRAATGVGATGHCCRIRLYGIKAAEPPPRRGLPEAAGWRPVSRQTPASPQASGCRKNPQRPKTRKHQAPGDRDPPLPKKDDARHADTTTALIPAPSYQPVEPEPPHDWHGDWVLELPVPLQLEHVLRFIIDSTSFHYLYYPHIGELATF